MKRVAGYVVRDVETLERMSGIYETRREAERRAIELGFMGRALEVIRTS